MIKLRQAVTQDLPLLLAFEQALIAYERPFTPLLKDGAISYYDLEAYIVNPEIEVVVATENEKLVGSGYALVKSSPAYKTPAHFAYLGFMFVLPSHRGRGINQMIINYLIDWAHSKDLKEIQLDVYAQNHSALKAYQKAGFTAHLVSMRLDTEK
jgi:GNAT superfamily N-acetyltransferase